MTYTKGFDSFLNMGTVIIRKSGSGGVTVAFPYNPSLVAKVKNIEGHRWYPEGKHWSFPDSNGTLEKILKAFEGEEIHIDPDLQVALKGTVPDLQKEQSGVVESGLSPHKRPRNKFGYHPKTGQKAK
ncbi:MAG: hypothetical protein HY099_02365 [Nitrospirae bacterium]|nr:hypothetical protein [Nitrospirota bacterium]